MPLIDLIHAVKEENLTKSTLERYRDYVVDLSAQMQLEKATLEKKEALFTLDEPVSEAALVRAWKRTEGGQRLIEIKNHIRIVNQLYDSIKSRLYSLY